MSNFRLRASRYHLTYASHLDIERYKVFIKSKSPGGVHLLSIVHEEGDAEEKDATPYEHTHVFVWFKNRLDSINPRFFDFDEIHPNIKSRASKRWMKTIVLKYHLGHKTKANGRKYFIEPVELYQEGVEDFRFEEDLIRSVAAAPTTLDAFDIAGVEVKSISDVIAIRSNIGKEKDITFQPVHGINPQAFKPYSGPEWNDKTHALVIRGPPGIGKTQWVGHHYPNTGVVRTIEELRFLRPPQHDTLLFDDCEFFNFAIQTQIALCSVQENPEIKIRYKGITKPRIRTIFCTNEGDPSCPGVQLFKTSGAIDRRVVYWDVKKGDLYDEDYANKRTRTDNSDEAGPAHSDDATEDLFSQEALELISGVFPEN